MKRTAIIFLLLALASAGAYLAFNNCRETPVQEQTRFLLDTYVTIRAPGGAQARRAIEKALDRIEEINVKFNALNNNSPLYRFNNENIAINDSEIVSLVETADEVSRQSDGAFDITVYPLVKLWGFYKGSQAVPSGVDISNCLAKVGRQNLVIRDGKLTKLRADAAIDLGGIAKGYAVGEALKVLKKEGLTSALIDAGGDIYALGQNNGRPWKIGIRQPSGKDILGALELTDASVSTSGDYERFFEKDGARYHHIFDPRTGYPARGVRSVTVVSKDATLADGYSTALFVLGPERGMKLAESNGTFEAIMMTDDGQILMTPGLAGKLDLKNSLL